MTRDAGDSGCIEAFDERLSAWLDGELDAAEEAELRRELEENPALAARLAQLERIDDALRRVPEPPVPRELLGRVRERIGEETRRGGRRADRRSPHPVPRRPRSWALPALAAAAAAAFALLALPRLREPPPEEARVARAPAPRPGPGATEPPPALPSELEPAPAPEEIALAMELESDADLEVIEVLDWLEALGEIGAS